MLYLKIDKIAPGMVLGKTLMCASGRVLLHAGVELRPGYIEKIKQLGFPGIYINNEFSKDIVVCDAIPDTLRHAMKTDIIKLFDSIDSGKFKHISKTVTALKRAVHDIIELILENKGTVPNIIDLKSHDEYTFQHSVSVAVISVVLGVALGYDRDWLFNLGMAAIFHDIGKTNIPLEILNKPGKFTPEEFDEMKKHSRYGYDYVKANLDLPTIVYVSVLEHHEKFNGEGYPEGISGGSITMQARIIAVADVYDAITSIRPYSTPMEPAEAYDYIISNSSIHFDPEVVAAFSRSVAPFPVGSVVKLSDGRRGVVAENYADCMLRPRIKLIPTRARSEEPEYVDLKNDISLISVTVTGMT